MLDTDKLCFKYFMQLSFCLIIIIEEVSGDFYGGVIVDLSSLVWIEDFFNETIVLPAVETPSCGNVFGHQLAP